MRLPAIIVSRYAKNILLNSISLFYCEFHSFPTIIHTSTHSSDNHPGSKNKVRIDFKIGLIWRQNKPRRNYLNQILPQIFFFTKIKPDFCNISRSLPVSHIMKLHREAMPLGYKDTCPFMKNLHIGFSRRVTFQKPSLRGSLTSLKTPEVLTGLSDKSHQMMKDRRVSGFILNGTKPFIFCERKINMLINIIEDSGRRHFVTLTKNDIVWLT